MYIPQVSSMQERERQTTDLKHPMYNQSAAPEHLRSRGSFLSKIHPPAVSKEAERLTLWKERSPNSPTIGLQPSEQLPHGVDSTIGLSGGVSTDGDQESEGAR